MMKIKGLRFGLAVVIAALTLSCAHSSVASPGREPAQTRGGGRTDSKSSPRGGDGSGGGNVIRSSKAELLEVIAGLPHELDRISDAYMTGGTIYLDVQLREELSSVTQKVLNQKEFVIGDETRDQLRAMVEKFDVVDKPCYEKNEDGDWEEKDASTEYRLGAPVCISATRLARFPKSSLKAVLLPLMFHELAHQFELGETEANRLQELADLYLKYRPIYVAAFRAYFLCGFTTKTKVSAADKLAISKIQNFNVKHWAKIRKIEDKQNALSCARYAGDAGESLDRIFNGKPWDPIDDLSLTKEEKYRLTLYQGYQPKDAPFTFLTLKGALTEPSLSAYDDCRGCKAHNIDPFYVMMLGGKAAMRFIRHELAREQNAIP